MVSIKKGVHAIKNACAFEMPHRCSQ